MPKLDDGLDSSENDHDEGLVALLCDLCPEVFSREIQLLEHWNNVHQGGIAVKQEKTDEKANEEECLSDENTKVKGSLEEKEGEEFCDNFKSNWIKKECEDISAQYTHMFHCEKCTQSFARKSFFERHFCNVHFNRKYQCPICLKWYNNSNIVNNHMKEVHDEILKAKLKIQIHSKLVPQKSASSLVSKPLDENRQLICFICKNRSFDSEKSLNIHLFAHEQNLICPFCKTKFSVVEDIEQHMSKAHIDETSPSTASSTSKVNRKTTKAHNAYTHIFFAHAKYTHHDLLKEGVFDFRCNVCDRHFETALSLELHNNAHLYTTCRYCGQVFSSQRKMNHHLALVHENISRRSSTNSPTKLNLSRQSKKLLLQTQDIESNNVKAKYSCPKCSKKFISKPGLIRHFEQHLGKQFQCPVCFIWLYRKDGVFNHARLSHKVRLNGRQQLNVKMYGVQMSEKKASLKVLKGAGLEEDV